MLFHVVVSDISKNAQLRLVSLNTERLKSHLISSPSFKILGQSGHLNRFNIKSLSASVRSYRTAGFPREISGLSFWLKLMYLSFYLSNLTRHKTAQPFIHKKFYSSMSILEFMQLYNVRKQIKDKRKQLHGFEREWPPISDFQHGMGCEM